MLTCIGDESCNGHKYSLLGHFSGMIVALTPPTIVDSVHGLETLWGAAILTVNIFAFFPLDANVSLCRCTYKMNIRGKPLNVGCPSSDGPKICSDFLTWVPYNFHMKEKHS